MTYTLRFLPEVEEDIIGGYVWYETKSPGLGEDFFRMFYAGASEILWNPLLCPKVYEEFRPVLLGIFLTPFYKFLNPPDSLWGVSFFFPPPLGGGGGGGG